MAPRMNEVANKTCPDELSRRLFKAVVRQIKDDWKTIYKNPEDYTNPKFRGVPGFVTFSQTSKFADRNLKDILLIYLRIGCNPWELVPKSNHENDWLNEMAWFALDLIIGKIIYYKEKMGGGEE
jgi:hypothetical protein